jgi:FkbM family methyltransferase
MIQRVLEILVQFLCRRIWFERGKFKILQDVYLRHVAPKPGRPRKTHLSFGISMFLDPSEFLQAHLFLFGSYELPTVRFIRKNLTPSSIFFDVGAQMGYLSLVAASAAKGVQVYAFEPEQNNLTRFNHNIALNDISTIRVVEQAVSDATGTLKLYLADNNNAGTHSTIPGVTNVSERFLELPCTTLDDFVRAEGISRIDLIKVDVEGGELEVIRGAHRTLAKCTPTLILEMSDALQEARAFSTSSFKQMLADMGYHAFTLTDAGALLPSAVAQGHAMENVVFVHEQRLESFRSQIVNA